MGALGHFPFGQCWAGDYHPSVFECDLDGRRVAWATWGYRGLGLGGDNQIQSAKLLVASYGSFWDSNGLEINIRGRNISAGSYVVSQTVSCLNPWGRSKTPLGISHQPQNLQPQELAAKVANHRLLFRIFAGRPGELVGAHRSAPSCEPFLSVWRLCALMAVGWLECNLFCIF